MRVMVAVPLMGWVPPQFAMSVAKLMADPPCEMNISLELGAGLCPARNNLAGKFLDSDATHLLFVDGDIEFVAADVARLVGHQVAIVGGLYAKKDVRKLEFAVSKLEGKTVDERGLLEVRRIGFGFVLIERRVLEHLVAMGEDWFTDADGRRKPAFFQMRVGENEEFLTEDWYFCQRARAAGFPIYADPQVQLKHHGFAAFPIMK